MNFKEYPSGGLCSLESLDGQNEIYLIDTVTHSLTKQPISKFLY
jgi:hypothetical protein